MSRVDRVVVVGAPPGADFTVLHGDLPARRFIVGYRDPRGRVAAALGWNAPRELRGHRRQVVDYCLG
jgi:hypothetical protein